MTGALTDEDLRRLRRTGGTAACNEPKILALLTDIVERYPDAKIHWLLPDGRQEILAGWLERRLIASGRLAAMIDKAGSVRALRAIAAQDLQQYADEKRRGELPTRLFKRLDKLLRADAERFQIMMLSEKPGSTYWTLASRPASAIFLRARTGATRARLRARPEHPHRGSRRREPDPVPVRRRT